MFKKSVRRIVAVVMTSLLLFLAITVTVIYVASYYSIKSQNDEKLADFVEAYSPSTGTGYPSSNWRSQRNIPTYEVTTFYSVCFNSDGNSFAVNNGTNGVYTSEEIVKIAKEAMASGQKKGTIGSLMYSIVNKDNRYTLVGFLDKTLTDDTLKTILVYSLISGGASMLVFFVVSLFVANWIVRPLKENDKKQRQFISDAGHELKTPVAIINANIDLLSREMGKNEWLSNIEYENERMSTLIKELLDLSHAESAETIMDVIDFSHLVNGEELPFETLAFERGLNLQCETKDGLKVEGNPTQLKQLVSILLDNAIKHSSGGKDINVQLRQEHRNAVLSVSNSAEEIPEGHLDRLFERFYRLDEARVSEDSHYGLGLAIAKAITAAHHGTIDVVSKHGLITFTVALPLKN